jgi:uncharacterized protein (DUF111 family)
MIGEERSAAPAGEGGGDVVVIEANIDDMTPQNFGYVTEKLLNEGALDVLTVPVQMKKGRPGHLLQVLAPTPLVNAISRIIFQETTTIGIRHHRAIRMVLQRESIPIETKYGRISIKVSRLEGEVVNFVPEYEECVRIAREKNVPLKTVQLEAARMYLEQNSR